MTTYLIAAAVTFVFTAVLTIAGVGAAFILIPVYYALGIDLRVAMAVALLLNSLAMICAQPRFMKQKLVMMDVALPIIIIATPLSPAGAYVSKFMPKDVLLWMFVAFLVFAASMMIFHHPREREHQATRAQLWGYGGGVGALAGFLGGMLGVGGGNFIVPVLVWLGFNPKKASATTSFVVIFSSFAGFLGHATLGQMSWSLLGLTAVGSVAGALLGAWLLTAKLNRRQVKMMIGLVLYAVAGKMIWKLLAYYAGHGKL
ncbi:MAG: sulfite exporter TauE/SafE family protein [Armatimonadetes bacterium]|nr:sulfite exporter TauE/SafE family protein [Armatimonadota bacterium]